MEFSLEINGSYHNFKVKDVSEAAELIRELTSGAPAAVAEQKELPELDVFGESTESGTVNAVMDSFRGTKTAYFVNALAGMEGHGGTDSAIKDVMSIGGKDVNLAPFVANISKTCKRMGVDMADVLVRREKRVRAGKYIYHYRLTNAAFDFVSMIPDLDDDEDFGIVGSVSEPQKQSGPTSEPVNAVVAGSIRAIVRAAATGKTIREISESTGLTVKQVRGAVNGANERYDKEVLSGGVIKYTHPAQKEQS